MTTLTPELLDKARRMAWEINKRPEWLGHSRHYRHIGIGHFSRVYHLADGLVLKVGGPGGYGSRQCTPIDGTCFVKNGRVLPDSWPKYVAWVQANYPELPEWAPVVHHVEVMRGSFYFAVCERLAEVGWEVPLPDYSARCVHPAAKAASAHASKTDMHNGNYMLRGNTVVLNDPWVPDKNLH